MNERKICPPAAKTIKGKRILYIIFFVLALIMLVCIIAIASSTTNNKIVMNSSYGKSKEVRRATYLFDNDGKFYYSVLYNKNKNENETPKEAYISCDGKMIHEAEIKRGRMHVFGEIDFDEISKYNKELLINEQCSLITKYKCGKKTSHIIGYSGDNMDSENF